MATVFIDYRYISWGPSNEDDSTNVWALETDASSTDVQLFDFGHVGTPVQNYQALATFPGPGATVHFVYWNATDGQNALPGFPTSDPSRMLNVPDLPSSTIVHASAWYANPGGDGPGTPHLRARTFDVDLNGFRKETPIGSAKPPQAWGGPNQHNVSTEKDTATATAKTQLQYPAPLSSQPAGEPPKKFKRWQPIVGPLTVTQVHDIGCAAHSSGLGVAFYGHSPRDTVVVGPAQSWQAAYDYWAEFWGKRGAEGEGPFGPGGPGEPWGPYVGRLLTLLSPEATRARLKADLERLQKIVDGMSR
jgi:hypothetical protein